MANDENSSEDVNDAEETSKASDVVETVKDAAEDVLETVTEAVEDAVETAEDAGESAVAKIMAIKESSPQLFFGGIGAIVLVVLGMTMMGGGGSNKTTSPAVRNVNISVGQTYALKGVNTTDSSATVRLVAVPGSIAAYDDTVEEGKEASTCKRMPQGTKVKILQEQSAFQATFVEVEILAAGKCQGRKGWVVSHNIAN